MPFEFTALVAAFEGLPPDWPARLAWLGAQMALGVAAALLIAGLGYVVSRRRE